MTAHSLDCTCCESSATFDATAVASQSARSELMRGSTVYSDPDNNLREHQILDGQYCNSAVCRPRRFKETIDIGGSVAP